MATDDDDTPENAAPAAPPARKGVGMGALLAVVILSIGASAGLSWFLVHSAVAELKPAEEVEEAEAEPEIPKEPANYIALDPAFVVNLDDEQASRFLQVQIEVMTRNKDAVEKVPQHLPRIRSALLLLLGQQTVSDLQSREGKEKLQAQVLDEINAILAAETGEGDIEAVYFTSFVIQ